MAPPYEHKPQTCSNRYIAYGIHVRIPPLLQLSLTSLRALIASIIRFVIVIQVFTLDYATANVDEDRSLHLHSCIN